MNTNKGIFKIVNRWLVAALLLTGSSTLLAAPLNFNLLLPDVTAPFMTTDYNAGSDAFTASTLGGGLTLEKFDTTTPDLYDTITFDINDGSFSLDANISAGGILNSGSLTILGTIPGLYTSGILLTGTITKLGFANDSSQTLEFVFDVTGGDLEPEYSFGLPTDIGGIILADSGYNDDNFNSSFSTDFSAIANIAPLPVPAAVWLFGSGLLGLAGIARRRS